MSFYNPVKFNGSGFNLITTLTPVRLIWYLQKIVFFNKLKSMQHPCKLEYRLGNKDLTSKPEVYKVPTLWFSSNCIHSSHWWCETQSHSSLCVSLWSCHFILSIQISKYFFLLFQCLVTFFINRATSSFIFTLNKI